MTRYRMAFKTFLVVVVLAVGAPAAAAAAHGAPHVARPATATPLNTNLLHNAGFEKVVLGQPIPKWKATGDAQVKTFDTTHWPTKAYAAKYHGGSRYVACGPNGGSISQTVAFDGGDSPPHGLTARLKTNFGGLIGHSMTVTITMTDNSSTQVAFKSKTDVLTTSNHYKSAVTTVGIPATATHITATLTMAPKAGVPVCTVVADTVQLYVYIFS